MYNIFIKDYKFKFFNKNDTFITNHPLKPRISALKCTKIYCSVRTMSIYNDKNYIDNVINLNFIKKQSKMTKNESKLLSIQGIAKASAFCLLLSAFSVNAAMAAPAPAGTVDEVMAVQQGKKVTGVVVDGTGEPVIGANVVVKGTTNGTITDFDGNYTIEGVPADGVLVISYIGYLSQEIPVGNQSAINVTLKEDTQTLMR